MPRCSYIYPKDTKKHKKGEQCNIYPKSGEVCFVHKKVTENHVHTKKLVPPNLLGKRPLTDSSIEESNISLFEFPNDPDSSALREYYKNKKTDDEENELTDVEVSDVDEQGPERPVRKVIIENSDGEECEMSDDGSEEDETRTGYDPDDPCHPVAIAKVGAFAILQSIEAFTDVPGFSEKLINMPMWVAALEKVLEERFADFETVPAEYVLVGITGFTWLQMKNSRIKNFTPPPNNDDGKP